MTARAEPSLRPTRSTEGASAVGRCPALTDGTLLMRVVLSLGAETQRFHRYVSSYATSRFSQTTAQRVGLATYELVENALKYGNLSSETIYELEASSRMFEVRVSNEAVGMRVKRLRDRIKQLTVSPHEVFATEMARACGEGHGSLGLARLVVEAQLTVELEDNGTSVTVRARAYR